MKQIELLTELERQVGNLIERGYPKVIGLSRKEFLDHVLSLKRKVAGLKVSEADLINGRLPVVIVVKSDLVTAEKMMNMVEKDGKKGVTILRPHTSENFNVIEGVEIPEGKIYLLVDIDRGKDNINLPPSQAMEMIKQAGRSPLTIDEGVAIVTQFPEFLMKNNCFSLLASRTGSDQRVSAIWINAKKEPNLGWCWDGNPHTWLGSASAVKRIGI